jgi:hypothetical protein
MTNKPVAPFCSGVIGDPRHTVKLDENSHLVLFPSFSRYITSWAISAGFANSAFSLLAVVVARSLGGIQLKTGGAIEIPLPHHDTQLAYGRISPLSRSPIPSNPTLALARPCFFVPLDTKIFFARTNLAAVEGAELVMVLAGHRHMLIIRPLRTPECSFLSIPA